MLEAANPPPPGLLQPWEAHVFSLVDGEKSVLELSNESEAGEGQTQKALYAFLATGIVRSRGRKVRVLRDYEHASPPAAPAATALERYSLEQCSERVRAALAQLPENQRRVLELAYYRGLSQSEIAVDLAASLGTVKSWARRGLLALRDALGDLTE